MTRLLSTALFSCILQLAFSQDVIFLRNGTRLEGKILDEQKKQIVFQLPDRDEPVILPKNQAKISRRDLRSVFDKSFSLDLFLGGELISPASGMEKILIEQGFDETLVRPCTESWLSLLFGLQCSSDSYKEEYPQKSNVFSYGFGLNYAMNSRSEVGMVLSFKEAAVSGYNGSYGLVHLQYRAFHAIPTYRRYSPSYQSYWEAGVPLNFFNLEESRGRAIRDVPTAFRPGLKIGGGLLFAKKHVRGLQLKLSYSIALPGFNMPDFELQSRYDKSQTIKLFEDHPISYQSLEVGIVYSFRLKL